MSYYAEHYHNLKKLVRPKGTTHAKILCDDKKKGFTPIKDFDVFQGVSGTVTFLKEKRDNCKVIIHTGSDINSTVKTLQKEMASADIRLAIPEQLLQIAVK